MSKAKRPNRIYGRQKDKQIQELKQRQQEKHDDYIQKMKNEGTYEGRSMFDFVSEYKTISYSVLTIIAVLAFVVGPAYYAAIQGGPNSGPMQGAGETLATWNGGSIERAEAIRIQEDGQRLQQFFSALANNALMFRMKDMATPNFMAIMSDVDPWQIGSQPSDPVTVKFLSTIANDYGIGVTADSIETHLQKNVYEYNTSEQIRAAKQAAFDKQLETDAIAEMLVPYVAARKMQRLADTGIPMSPAISDRGVIHKMLSTKHQFEILEIPVNQDAITSVPDEDELEARLEAFREYYRDETGLNQFGPLQVNNQNFLPFGARTPRKFGYQFVAFDEDAYDRYARVLFEAGIEEDDLKTYYETNIENYIAPEDVFENIENEAEGDGGTEDGGTEDGGTDDSTDDQTEADSGEDPAGEADSTEENETAEDASETPAAEDDCVTLFQDEPEQPADEAEEATETEPTEADDNSDDAPAEPDSTEDEAADESATGEDEKESEEDLSGLDTPIPLEPNVIAPAPKTYLPYEEVADRVREDYIRTSISTYKDEMLGAHKQQITDAMDAFANAESSSGEQRFAYLASVLDVDNIEEAESIKQAAAAELAKAIAEIQKDAAGILSEDVKDADGNVIEAGEQIVLATLGQTDFPISAAYGQAISGRNPNAADFGLEWDETTPSWIKLVRTAYKAHGGPGSNPESDIFIENDFLTPHESQFSTQKTTYVFWQVEQTKETPFDAGLENEEVKQNLIDGWKYSKAIDAARKRADSIAALYTADNGDQPFSQIVDDTADLEIYKTFPTAMVKLSQFNPQGGVELGTIQKFEIVTNSVPAPIQDNPDKTEEESTEEEATEEEAAEEEATGDEATEEDSAEGESTEEDDTSECEAEEDVEPAEEAAKPDVPEADESESVVPEADNSESDVKETDEPEMIEVAEMMPTVTISDISDGDKQYMFQQMEVNKVQVFASITGRVFYVVRKIEYKPTKDDPTLPFDFFSPVEFDQLVKYLADGRSPGMGGMGGMIAGMTVSATDNMYRSPQGNGGTVANLSSAFIAVLQKKYNYATPQSEN